MALSTLDANPQKTVSKPDDSLFFRAEVCTRPIVRHHAAIGEGLFVATERGLVLIERNGDVERIGSLSVDPTEGAPSAVPGEAGLEILDVRDGLLRRWMISNEAITTSQDLVRGQTGFGNVLYADSDVAVTSSATGDRAIQLSER